ncbi:MAG: hypothetical protein EB829_03350 [Nitrosopumilus sp. H8]|nr:MAG: hypothetical protein EB829_03350 [Nitrosopumilus sp. H8]
MFIFLQPLDLKHKNVPQAGVLFINHIHVTFAMIQKALGYVLMALAISEGAVPNAHDKALKDKYPKGVR